MNPAVVLCTTWMGGVLMRRKRDLCHPHEAAERLGISVDKVLNLMSTGELAAVMYMDEDRWFVELDSLEWMARKPRRQDTRRDGWLRRGVDFLHLPRR